MNANFNKKCLCSNCNDDNLFHDGFCKLCKQKRVTKENNKDKAMTEFNYNEIANDITMKILNKSSSVQDNPGNNNNKSNNKNLVIKRNINIDNTNIKPCNNNYEEQPNDKKNYIKISQNELGII